MFDELKNYFDFPIICKECGKTMRFGIVAILHCLIVHKSINKTTVKWALRRGLEMRILLFPFILIYLLIMAICWPFWWVYEHLGVGNWW